MSAPSAFTTAAVTLDRVTFTWPDGSTALDAVSGSFGAGRTGLVGAMWLAPARQVHTFRMKFTIDVAYVGRSGEGYVVLRTATMPPGKLGPWMWRAKGVIEAEGGMFETWGLQPGTRVEFTSPADVSVGS